MLLINSFLLASKEEAVGAIRSTPDTLKTQSISGVLSKSHPGITFICSRAMIVSAVDFTCIVSPFQTAMSSGQRECSTSTRWPKQESKNGEHFTASGDLYLPL